MKQSLIIVATLVLAMTINADAIPYGGGHGGVNVVPPPMMMNYGRGQYYGMNNGYNMAGGYDGRFGLIGPYGKYGKYGMILDGYY
ncbi:hypothetical protein BLA29_003493 [Euroglyphus maynei]|uniref:Uncharacterized protein n=1 Tax=Euroglyphus maynei TaxID=6958 RepID=A0A1Y3BEG5_EURMA|nr:hypothetical protein BLA29_003493 [Euroglyphus maynei]